MTHKLTIQKCEDCENFKHILLCSSKKNANKYTVEYFNDSKGESLDFSSETLKTLYFFVLFILIYVFNFDFFLFLSLSK